MATIFITPPTKQLHIKCIFAFTVPLLTLLQLTASVLVWVQTFCGVILIASSILVVENILKNADDT